MQGEATIKTLIQQAKDSGVTLYLKGDKLAFIAEKNKFDPLLKAQIGQNKQAIIEHLLAELELKNQSAYNAVTFDAQSPVVASNAQKRLWFIEQFESGTSQYNLPVALKFSGAFDIDAAQSALQQIIERHQSLRTVFTEGENGPQAKLINDFSFAIERHDLSELTDEIAQQQLEQLAEQNARKPFDLSQDLMIRAEFAKLADNQSAFLLCMHHIASDGWSIKILVDEFSRLYQAKVSGGDAQLLPLAIQYKDYAHWQNQWLASEQYQTQADYWQKQLDQLPAVHQLPLDYPRPSHKQFAAGTVQSDFSLDILNRLQQVAKAHHITPFMLLHGAFALVLSHHANQQDIVVGTAVANRRQAELETLIGFFANTLVLRTNTGHPHFSNYLAHIKSVNLAAQSHQDVPFEHLVELLKAPRSAQFTPLYQIMFNMNTVSGGELSMGDVGVEYLGGGDASARYDLELDARMADDGLHLLWIFDASLFLPATVQAMADDLARLLGVIAKGEDFELAKYPLISNEAQQQLLALVNQPVVDYPQDQLIHQLFECQAVKSPNAVAVQCGDEQISYCALNAKANQLARQLVEQGVQAKSVVGVCQKRSIDMLTSILAIFKAGGIYLPLDPDYPQDRLSYQLEDSGCELVLRSSDVELPADINTIAVNALNLDGYSQDNLSPSVAPEQCAYIIYTSGSTGRPKGVMIAHKNACAMLHWASNVYSAEQLSRVLFSTSICFDISLFELFAPLCVGGCVVVVDSILSLTEQTVDVTLINSVPSAAKLLLEQNAIAKSVTTINLAGEFLPQSVVEQLYNAGIETVYDLYGPSEDTTYSTQAKRVRGASATIGKPIHNTQAYVLDNDLRMVAQGVTGELFLAGDGVALGYHGQPELTAERFIANPFDRSERFARLYRTGDLVRVAKDGQLVYVGRADDQVKIRGFRIEPGEVREQIQALDGVKQAVVRVLDSSAGQKQLVAFVVAQDLDAGDIKHKLSAVLPEYMVPARYLLLDELPLTPNGKVDNRLLDDMAQRSVSGDSYKAPSSELEFILRDIWSGLLNIDQDQLSITDNFFALGGDSILSISVVSQLAAKGYVIEVKDLFDGQTIEQLAQQVKTESKVVAEQGWVSGALKLLPIAQDFFKDPTDLHHYNQAVMLKVPHSVDEALLKQMFRVLVARHDAMRLCFEPSENGWQGRFVEYHETWVDTIVRTEKTNDINGLADSIQQEFNLAEGPLFRAVLIEQTSADKHLLLTLHHLIVDGVSWRIILNDLGTLYQQAAANQPLQLGPKTSSVAQWSEFVSDYANSDKMRAQADYWQGIIAAPGGVLAQQQSTEHRLQSISVSLPQAQTRQLLTDAHKPFGTRINELLLAGLMLALKRNNDLCAFTLDMEGHGREPLTNTLDLSQTLGWFTSVYPLHLTGADPSDLAQFICQIKETVRAVPDNGIGFGLLKAFSQQSTLTEAKPSELVFNYLGQFDQVSQDDSGFAVSSQYSGRTVSENRAPSHPLALNSMVSEGCLTVRLDFNACTYGAEQMQTLLNALQQALVDINAFCVSFDGRYFTPSDFPLANVDSETLNQWQQQYAIADLYPATGMQQGMLFHSLVDNSGYVSLFNIGFAELDIAVFKNAWQQIAARHQVFSTAFVGLKQNLAHQLVCADSQLPWQELDYSSLDGQAQQQALQSFVQAQGEQGFDIEQAPLMRMSLVKLANNAVQFVWAHHHALLDGWSMPQVFQEVMVAYQAGLKGQSAELPAPVPYKNFVAYLAQQDWAAAENYWSDLLADVQSTTPLPLIDEQKLQSTAHTGIETTTLTVAAAELKAIVDFARQSKVTVNVVMQAAWAILLSRYSGQSIAAMGNTVSGRPPQLAGVESMVGLFINTLPLVATIDNRQPLSEFVGALHQQINEREQYSYLPLAQIQKLSSLALNQGNLFDSIVVSENHREQVEHQDADVLVNSAQTQIWTNYPLSLITYVGEQLDIKLEVRKGLLSQVQATEILGHFKQLLSAIADNAQGSLADISMFAPEQMPALKSQTPFGPEHQTTGRCWAQNFALQAEQNPDKLAVCFEDTKLTFGELDVLSNRLANLLIEMDVQGQRIGIHMNRCLQLPLAILAVHKAGCSYVALDPSHPKDRIDYQLKLAEIEMVLLCSDTMESLPLSGVDVFLLDDAYSDDSWLDDMESDAPDVELSLTDEAYVLFTSGSTGRPKGVQITQGGLSHYLEYAARTYCRNTDGSIVSSPLCFDATLTTLLTPLIIGQSITLLSQDDDIVPQLFEAMTQSRNKLFKITPAHLQALGYVAHGELSQAAHQLVLGGEQLPSEPVIRWLAEHLPNGCFHNEYGPTETVVGCCVYSVDSSNIAELKSSAVPIGKAIDNTRLYVLDGAEHQPNFAPVGSIGELYIENPGVALGYLKQDELTAKSFADGLAHLAITGRLYKTGDLVKTLDNGDLLFVGRADTQIKIRGYRIDPDEIAAVLLKHPAISQVAVKAVETSAGQQQLVAWLACSDENIATTIGAQIAKDLPQYMIPSSFVVLEQLPLTVNGKVDSRQLPHPEQSTEGQAPQTATEQAIHDVWCEVLKREQLGLDDNFFAIGGDSILSIQVISLLANRQLMMEVHDLFDCPTIRTLASRIEQSAPMAIAPEPIEPFALLTDPERAEVGDDLADAYPMATLQQGMVFHSELAGFDGVYHDINREVLQCPWQQAKFEQALQLAMQRHPVLRTCFKLKGQRPLQLVKTAMAAPLEVSDLQHLQAQAQQATINQWEQTRRKMRFDWLNGPLFQVDIFLTGENTFEFILSFHHAILDGWSRVTLIGELYRDYLALLAGNPVDAVIVDNTMAAFVALEQAAIDSRESAEYFAQLLQQVPAKQLPPCADPQTQGHLRYPVNGFERLSGDLIRLAEQQQVPLQVVLLAGHLKLLSVFSGQDNAMSCITVNGRPERTGAEQALGLYLNTVPLIAEVEDLSWATWIEKVARSYNGLIEHRRYPYAEINRVSDAPLDEVLFNYTHFHALDSENDSDAPESVNRWLGSTGIEVTNFSLLMDVSRAPGQDSLALFLAYHQDKFSAEFIAHLGELYVQLFSHMVKDVTGPHRSCVLRKQLTSVNEASVPSMQVQQLFEQKVLEQGEHEAVVFDQLSISYRALNHKANQLAHHLRELGVKADDGVALCFERSLEMVVAIVAVLKAGGAYVPLDPEHPAERRDYVLENSKAKVLLTCDKFGSHFNAQTNLSVICLGDCQTEQLLSRYSNENPVVVTSDDNLAYIIYTSGSTGTPKGVMLPHGALSNRIAWMDKAFTLTSQDRVLQKTPYTFDVSVWEFVWTLAYGGTLVVAEPARHGDPQYLNDLIVQQNITRLHFVPSMLNAYLHAGFALAQSVKSVFCSGEALEVSDASLLLERNPQIQLHNLYGPTEAAIDVSWYPFDPARALSSVPIGKAIDNIALYVLDHDLNPLPQGAVGELHIGGIGLARGYAGRLDLTAQSFIDNPFGEGRLYKTGDLVRELQDGNLDYLGRIDNQVKLRGLRIELSEIEHVLNSQSEISACTVIVRDFANGEKQLVAYLVGSEVSDLNSRLAQHLPAYMVPQAYVYLDKLPLSANGKIDRKALPAPDMTSTGVNYEAPQTQMEQRVAELWGQLLQLDSNKISRDADFFALGGHSLLAVRLSGELNDGFGCDISLRQIFDYPQLSALGQLLERQGGGNTVAAIEAVAVPGNGYPLSFAQQRLWFIDRFGGGSAQYNMPCVIDVDGSFDAAIAEQAWQAIIERQYGLRTVYRDELGEGMQFILPEYHFSIERHDLSHLAQEVRETHLAQLIFEHQTRVFNLSADLPVRVAYVRISEEKGALLFNMHHIAADGWSMNELVKAFSACYQAIVAGLELPLPDLEVQYADFSLWQRNWMATGGADNQLEYWRQQLQDVPSVHGIPLDYERPAVKQYHGDSISAQLPGEVARQLIAVAQRLGVTPFMLLHGALAQMISRHSYSNDIVIGTPVANRRHQQLQPLVGFFANTLVLRSQTGFTTLNDYMAHIKEVNLAAQENQDVPFEQLVELLQLPRDSAHTPLFQILFTVNNNDKPAEAMADMALSVRNEKDTSAKFDLNISAEISNQGIFVECNYDVALFTQAHIEQMCRHWLNLIKAYAATPEQPLAQMPMLGDEEKLTLLAQSRRSVQAGIGAQNVPQLFAKAQVLTPQALAVWDSQTQLSYGELEHKTNQLAQILAARGIGKGSRVGVCVGRSVYLSVATLAVLKTGAAYVPMDPDYPIERLQYLVEDSAMSLLLCDSETLSLGIFEQSIDVTFADYYSAAQSGEALKVAISKDDLCYLIYTSGSTGLPKGVMMPHGVLVNLIEGIGVGCQQLAMPLKTLQYASSGFDMCFTDMFMAISSGGSLYMIDKVMQLDIAALIDFIATHGIERMNLPYAVLAQMAALGARQNTRLEQLKVVISTAEQLRINDDIRKFFAANPNCRLVNHYGPSETHCVTDLILDSDPYSWPHIPSIGRLLPNVRGLVLDNQGELAPANGVGELYICEEAIADGYLNRDELTQERFVASRFDTGQRLYRTGDLVRYLDDDLLHYMGRGDMQIKINGFRVEPGEIEQQLNALPQVEAAHVKLQKKPDGNALLAAYVVTDKSECVQYSDNQQLAKALKDTLAQKLPRHLVPNAIVVLDALPLTHNGKVDARALPQVDTLASQGQYVAPQTATEQQLCVIWAELLSLPVERISSTANFFELGGHSLLCVKLSALIKQQFAVDLSVAVIFQSADLKHLAAAISAQVTQNTINQNKQRSAVKSRGVL